MGHRVRRIRTSVSEPQMAQAIIMAWKELFGNVPSKAQVSLVLAQNALETGNRKSMYNYNIGNITTDGKGSFDFYDGLITNEQVHSGIWKKKNLKYRAYPSLKDGVKDYLLFLSQNKNYSTAWQHILHPDPVAFSKALKGAGYYTANEEGYTNTLKQLYNHIGNSGSYELASNMKIMPPSNISSDVPRSTGTINHIEDLIGNFLKNIAASKSDNKMYKKYLPRHNAVISISAQDRNNALEFARLLTLALDEELSATASVHGQETVEVECNIFGPEMESFAAIQQLCDALAEAFKDSTHKIGGVKVKAKVFSNKISSHQLVSISKLEMEHRKFLLKLAKG